MRVCLLFLFPVLCFNCDLLAADYYVAPWGSDDSSGLSADQPFATIQKAADLMGPGDTCYLREGTYHEAVEIADLYGTEESPVTFRPYMDESVTMDGTVGITGTWEHHSGNIFKTTLEQDIWQLFDDGEMMIVARWPNAFLHDGSIWDQQGTWGLGTNNVSSNGTLVDSANNGNDLAATGMDITGAMGIMNVGSFKTYPRKVTSHTAGSNTFSYNPVPEVTYRNKHLYYFLEGKLQFLDASREWHYDKTTKTLYLWAADGQIPSGNIRGKVQPYAFRMFNCRYVTIDGLNFFGTTFSFQRASHCIVRNCDLEYPTFSRRILGSEDDMESTHMQASGLSQPGNTLFNCSIQHTDGMAVHMDGAGSVIDNNYMHSIDFSVAGMPGLMVTVLVKGEGAVIRRNRIDLTGASSAISPGKKAITELNRISRTGFLQSDGSCIHRMVPDTPDSINRYNWVHDTSKWSLRYDGNPGGTNGLSHHNVLWNAKATRFKGDLHGTYNNTGFDPRPADVRGNINIALDKGGNPNSVTRNNAATLITDDPLPGIHSNNYEANDEPRTMRELLRDPDNLDFRPRADATELVDGGAVVDGITDGYIGSAPDIGAYEYGDDHYWIAGRKERAASTPVPPNLAQAVKPDADLMWLEALDASSRRVWFGTNPFNLVDRGVVSGNIFDPGPLEEGRTYFWRVDSTTPEGTMTGQVWSFVVGDGELLPVLNIGLDSTPGELNLEWIPEIGELESASNPEGPWITASAESETSVMPGVDPIFFRVRVSTENQVSEYSIIK